MRSLFGAEAASIGIIGGADGPTAIFVAGGSAMTGVLGLCLAALAVVLIVALIKRG